MRSLTLFTLLTILFTACSFKTPPNQWQYKSVNAFDSYTKNFLSSNDLLSESDLQRAIKHAKVSANLTSLAKIYLGECALNISVGIKDSCLNYAKIQDLLHNRQLDAYYSLLRLEIDKQSLKNLPSQYKLFSENLQKQEYTKANENIFEMDRVTSTLVSATLLEDKITTKSIERVLELSSLYGYKKSVLYWLERLKNRTHDEQEIKIIEKKIRVLNE
ncbi:MAG: hypothetical protein DRG78_18850 [Epsilonproteobacteria bacterium]|nr:MAG: hypothetical protein DRG78_18850 [Campylobacterota bacterium]